MGDKKIRAMTYGTSCIFRAVNDAASEITPIYDIAAL